MQDANEDRRLKSATQWQKRPRVTGYLAGDEAAHYLRRTQRDFSKNAALVDVWDSIIPPGLKPWCRLDRRTGNVLTIQAAPGPYMHQLVMMQHELLDELHRRCPAAGVQKLRIIPLKDEREV